jgi:hypothetical protein
VGQGFNLPSRAKVLKALPGGKVEQVRRSLRAWWVAFVLSGTGD